MTRGTPYLSAPTATGATRRRGRRRWHMSAFLARKPMLCDDQSKWDYVAGRAGKGQWRWLLDTPRA